ncbi:ribosomal protein S5 domain 2-type protein [Dipodascopsis uninucleata]
MKNTTMISPPFLVSAPGKVILFGEHAAVYSKPAIAAALSLRSYLLVTKNDKSDEIALEYPDVKFRISWEIATLPWNAAPKRSIDTVGPPTELHTELVDALEVHLSGITNPPQKSAVLTFLYLYMSLCTKDTPGTVFAVRSTLPISAGLGSSASISVCLATGLCLLSGEVSPPENTKKDEGEFNAVNYVSIELINAWAFLGERCIHGNPSGIDNAVASHGGAVMYQRTSKGNPNVCETMRSFPSLRLLLIDSKQPRRTLTQVANVGHLVKSFPLVTEPVLNGIHALTDEAYKMLQMPKEKCDSAWANRLRELVRLNHGLLVALGVSHPKLEAIRMAADELGIGETKLTGAGGGGCAITLVRDDVAEESINELRRRLESQGFEMFETRLGGHGAACLFPMSASDQEFEEWEKKIFSSAELLALANRSDVEAHIGVGSRDEWKFW